MRFLQEMQRIIGSRCCLGELFDLAVGTSSGKSSSAVFSDAHVLPGGLIVLGIFLKDWSIDHCVEAFETLSKQFFKKRKGIPFRQLKDMLTSWLADGQYDAVELERTFEQAYGGDRMFGCISQGGTKVAVTATTISQATAYVFSNYNGCQPAAFDCGPFPFDHVV